MADNAFIKRLREQRANVWEQSKALLDSAASEGRDLTADEQRQYDTQGAELDQIADRVKDLEESEQRQKDAAEAMERLLAQPVEHRQDEEDPALRAFLKGESRAYDLRPAGKVNFRDLTKGTATAGGNTVPTSFYGQLIQHLIEVSGVLMSKPTVLNTDGGESIEVPTTTAHSLRPR